MIHHGMPFKFKLPELNSDLSMERATEIMNSFEDNFPSIERKFMSEIKEETNLPHFPRNAAMITFGNRIFRCAGWRIPDPGELYLSKTGKVKSYVGNPKFVVPRTILREWDPENDFKGEKK